MNVKVLMLLVISFFIISYGKPQLPQDFGQEKFFGPEGGFGNANAAGLGNAAVFNGQAIGEGTSFANVGPGGFAIGLGVGAAVDTPLGELTIAKGESISVGK